MARAEKWRSFQETVWVADVSFHAVGALLRSPGALQPADGDVVTCDRRLNKTRPPLRSGLAGFKAHWEEVVNGDLIRRRKA